MGKSKITMGWTAFGNRVPSWFPGLFSSRRVGAPSCSALVSLPRAGGILRVPGALLSAVWFVVGCGGASDATPLGEVPLPAPRVAPEPLPLAAASSSTTVPRSSSAPVPPLVPAPRGTVAQIVANGEVTCARFSDGEVRCWGNNQFNVISNEFARLGETGVPKPRVVRDLPPAVEIALGSAYACARLADGTLRCWGMDDGDLGLGTPLPPGPPPHTERPMPVLGLSDVVSLSARNHVCAVSSDRSVRCWADYDRGNGDPRDAGSRSPVVVSGFAGALQISDGGNLSCARFLAHVKCWRDISPGRIPKGSVRESPYFVAVKNAASIAAGDSGACAVTAIGGVTCWGQVPLNYGENSFGTTPRPVPGFHDVVSLSLGGELGCAVVKSGEVVCSRASDANHVPTKVEGVTNAVEVAVGGSHACARTADGRLLCWGENGMGQLGDGTTKDRDVPRPVVW